MKEFIEKLIEKIKSKSVPLGFGLIPDEKVIRETDAISIVNQLAEEYKDKSSIIDGLMAFLKEKFDHCAEQAGMNLEAECNSEIASYFRDRKELYLDRANIYGEVMRECDRLAEEYDNDFCEWKKVVIDSTELIREPHRMYLFKESDDKWEYCPYCGKKIKVVPYQPKGE